MRIAMTGATGLLGRNLLLEAIKQYRYAPSGIEIVILGRPGRDETLRQRVERIVLDEGPGYVFGDADGRDELRAFCDHNLRYVEATLGAPDLGIEATGMAVLQEAPIDWMFHSAAATDFRDSERVVERLEAVNVEGTRLVTSLAARLGVGEFCYVGSAYACGNVHGVIEPDAARPDLGFRNPYERTKLDAERVVRDFAATTGIRTRIFRPSTLCGRLLEDEPGQTPKFDVFYAWAAFFLRWKLKALTALGGGDPYDTPLDVELRSVRSVEGGLNIVPADFAAKTMLAVCAQNAPGDSFHLVNNHETPHELYIDEMVRTLNLRGVRYVDEVPRAPNRLEAFYYKTIARILAPYVTQPPMLFSVENLSGVYERAGLRCPPVNRMNIRTLMGYAKGRNFGVPVPALSGA